MINNFLHPVPKQYGFIIGQINEVEFLPKYVPAFFILLFSSALEIVLLALWNDGDFEMVDPLSKEAQLAAKETRNSDEELGTEYQIQELMATASSSLAGTLKLSTAAASVFKQAHLSDEIGKRLEVFMDDGEASRQEKTGAKQSNKSAISSILEKGLHNNEKELAGEKGKRRNPQWILLKMILAQDGRALKYIIVFTMYGFLHAPVNFVFLGVESVCHERGYNFSQLAGCMMISLASVETLAFLIAPWFLNRCVSRSNIIGFGFVIMTIRYGFYSGWYYTGEISPYWAVLGEWGLGLSYALFCTIQAEVSLMLANESRLFIPELRRLGYLGDEKSCTKEQLEEEERSVKMALRATVQALLDGFMSGLGFGAGALICGLLIEVYSYSSLWRIICIITAAACLLHQLVEVTRSRWSDSRKPPKGTIAFEIMELSKKLKEVRTSQLVG